MTRTKAKKKQKKRVPVATSGSGKKWSRTGIGCQIKMESEIIEGKVCVRLATMKCKSCRLSLYFDYSGKQFFSLMSTITNAVLIEVLPSLDHAQLLYNKLPRRVHPDRLESMGIVNPLETDLGDLEEDLADQVDDHISRAV